MKAFSYARASSPGEAAAMAEPAHVPPGPAASSGGASGPAATANAPDPGRIAELQLLRDSMAKAASPLGALAAMDAEGFGHCSNHLECEAACPKEISVDFIARMNRDFLKAMVTSRTELRSRDAK